MSILLTDRHVERAVTLLALILTATNPVERERYEGRLKALRSQHPEVHAIRDDDPRVTAAIADLRAMAEAQIIDAVCQTCGVVTGKRLSTSTEVIYCHECAVKRMFKEAAKR